MPIQRLGLANPSANIDTAIATFADNYLVSVVVANKNATATPVMKVSIWVVPSNTVIAAQWAYIAYNLSLPVGSSFETFRFAVNSGDTLYVRSNLSTSSFSVNGVEQEDSAAPENIAQTFYPHPPCCGLSLVGVYLVPVQIVCLLSVTSPSSS